ncbi:MAG: amidase [Gammaproteobacteria bacterium]|nr:amidase [Gammaproteobacteria bacterium]
MSAKDYAAYDGLGLARLVKRGEVSADELFDAAMAAHAVVNPKINAVLQTLPKAAKAATKAGLPEGPFTGVPLLIKELILHAKGVRCDMGSRLAQGYVARSDTELMARFRRAGFVLAGTTQTPELGYNPTTECVLFGPVHNPWDLTRSAGGSSGGSGAAVAAGIVPIAHASDGGGSIRIPAACNGLVGLKPSRDRIPSGPDYGDLLCGWAVEFAVTRSVRDAAALLDAVAGPDVGAPHLITPPTRPYTKELKAAPGKLKIAWTTTIPSGQRLDPECKKAVERTVTTLEGLGHTLVEAAPKYDWEHFLAATHVVWTTFTAQFVEALCSGMNRRADRETLEAVTLACCREGQAFSAVDLLNALAHGNRLSRVVGEFFAGFDALVTPTTARIAAPLGELNQARRGMSARGWAEQVFSYIPFTPLFNTTGNPAISLPLYSTAENLPVGTQIVGRMGDEATLLRLASQLEIALPWAGRRPAVHVAN